jgi:hypothetical protein
LYVSVAQCRAQNLKSQMAVVVILHEIFKS